MSFSDLAKEDSSSLLQEISAVQEALDSQSIGVSVSYDDFNSDALADYRDCLEFINGSLVLNEENVKKLTKEKVEEQVATNLSLIHISRNLGDITKVDENNLSPFNMICGGSPCFVAGTKVFTKNGYKNIEDIKVGDMVLTHRNRFMPVLRLSLIHISFHSF